MHRVEKPNKCNQCDYASSQAGDLRKHLKTHNGEKSNKCNQCDYVTSLAGDLRIHLKTHSGNSQTNSTNAKCGHWVTSHPLVPKLITRLSSTQSGNQ